MTDGLLTGSECPGGANVNEAWPIGRAVPRKVGIVVAGMHRAGTSATARVVNLLGADISRDLMPGDLGINDRGFWESEAIAGIHDRLLYSLGSSWDDPMPLPDGWLETEAASAAEERLAAELQKDFSGSRVFVTKDPRVSRVLPLWLAMFGRLSIEPLVVIPFRNPLEVANSLEKRDHFPLGKSLLLFVRSYLDTELASRGSQRIFVHYQDLIGDRSTFVAALQRALGELWPPQNPDGNSSIDSYLSAELRRNRSSRDDLVAPAIPRTVVDMYDQMVAASHTGDDAALRRAFDDIRANVTEATKLFGGLVSAERERYREIRAPVSQLNATLEARSAEAEGLKVDAVRLSQQLGEAHARVSELDAAVQMEQAKVAVQTDVVASQANVIADQQDVIASQKAMVTSQAAIVANQRDVIAGMQQSTSWRATAPLRLIKRWAAKLVGLGPTDVASRTPR